MTPTGLTAAADEVFLSNGSPELLYGRNGRLTPWLVSTLQDNVTANADRFHEMRKGIGASGLNG